MDIMPKFQVVEIKQFDNIYTYYQRLLSVRFQGAYAAHSSTAKSNFYSKWKLKQGMTIGQFFREEDMKFENIPSWHPKTLNCQHFVNRSMQLVISEDTKGRKDFMEFMKFVVMHSDAVLDKISEKLGNFLRPVIRYTYGANIFDGKAPWWFQDKNYDNQEVFTVYGGSPLWKQKKKSIEKICDANWVIISADVFWRKKFDETILPKIAVNRLTQYSFGEVVKKDFEKRMEVLKEIEEANGGHNTGRLTEI